MAWMMKITSGPSKWDLMLGLFDNTSEKSRYVAFVLDKPTNDYDFPHGKVEISIDSLEREDGSGDSWNITGRLRGSNQFIRAFFSTKRRKGTLTQDDQRSR